MGLGKTLQMIAHILARRGSGGTLSPRLWCALRRSCTTGLPSWSASPPSLDVCAIVGAKAQRRVQIAGVAEHNVVVTVV